MSEDALSTTSLQSRHVLQDSPATVSPHVAPVSSTGPRPETLIAAQDLMFKLTSQSDRHDASFLGESDDHRQRGGRRHQELTATNLQAIPNADELAPGIRLGPQGNEAFIHHPHDADRGEDDSRDHTHARTHNDRRAQTDGPLSESCMHSENVDAEQGDDIDDRGRRASILTSSSDAHLAGEGVRSGPPSQLGSIGPSASLRATGGAAGQTSGRKYNVAFSNTVGHFGSRGEPVAGVPPELDPRASNFRPPSPSAASIYSVSVQAPVSPQAVEQEADDYTSHHPGHGHDEHSLVSSMGLGDFDHSELSLSSVSSMEMPSVDTLAGGDGVPTRRITVASITHSPFATSSYSIASVAGSSYPPTPGSTSGVPSGIPNSTLDQIRANPRGLVFSPSAGAVPIGGGLFTAAAGGSGRTDITCSPSVAATAGSEYPASSYSGSFPASSRPPSIRDETASPPLSAGGSLTTNPGESQRDGLKIASGRAYRVAYSVSNNSSSALSASSDAIDEDDGSPSGGRATSFAGTSVGAASSSSAGLARYGGVGMGAFAGLGPSALSSSSFTIPSIAPSEAGSGADESDLALPPPGQDSVDGDDAADASMRTAPEILEEGVTQGGMPGTSVNVQAPSHPSFTATGPASRHRQHYQQSQQLPLSFGPGLAAFRSLMANAAGAPSRAASTAATAGTSSPTRSVISTGSASGDGPQHSSGHGRRDGPIAVETVGSTAVQSEGGTPPSSVAGGLSSRRIRRQLSSSTHQQQQQQQRSHGPPTTEMEALGLHQTSKPPSTSGSIGEEGSTAQAMPALPQGTVYEPGTAF
ncbi:hypothetical protein K437DRAFT_257032 [Tilletiaria anomala UBC 951]|uniref:Uncharacterized protein n=1 Tax=Tilletiaria anomala (strain ATCC 24038 / CBS 436.72 / UBC 951) TaxID=1037660 RepID=A0A066VW51_TILAU|nr:uncharacterized protein K437DRAFT_257032 [Tilletiaria anomala UBC 951]KDN44513.1 hypothetical protein K437DRAFT_257032 [Tilletiaria anomala UBC 951]